MSDERIRYLEQRVAKLERAIRLQFAISRTTSPAVDTGPVQTTQGRIDALSLRDGMPSSLSYGFSSSMPIGGDQVVVFLGGDRSQGIVVATGHQTYRFTGLQPGESVQHDMWEHFIRMTEAGLIINGNATWAGNLSVTGSITATGNVTAGLGTADQVDLLGHEHTSGEPGTRTSPPIAGT